MDQSTPTYTTKLWKRSQHSWATTIPKQILLMRGAPVENAQIEWRINENGELVIEFSERDEDA